MKFRFVIFITFLIYSGLFSQCRTGLKISVEDSVRVKRPVVSSSMVLAEDLMIWSIDRYIKKAEFSYISFNTIKRNLKTGFVYDNDCMQTNMFDHPFHGGMNYNIARSAGFNYWQSLPFNVGGSLVWELFLENEPPSLPDLISSSIGGLLMGEVTYRLSSGIYLNQSHLLKRTGVELGSFVLNPSRTLIRIILGNNISQKKIKFEEAIPLEVNAALGFSIFMENSNERISQLYPVFYTNIKYNQPFNHAKYKPFDFFNVNVAINLSNRQPLLKKLIIEGVVWGKNKYYGDKISLMYGVFQQYDYYDSNFTNVNENIIPYKFAFPASFGAGTILHFNNKKSSTKLSTELYMNFIMIGSSFTPNYLEKYRNYNFGYGYSQKFYLRIINEKIGSFNLGLKYFNLITEDKDSNQNEDLDDFEIEGDDGDIDNIVFNTEIELYLTRKTSLSFCFDYFYRNIDSIYKQDSKSSMMELNVGGIFYF
ncbi:MAG TPA: DUF3943 domain-containing protein [Bacteroidetes bacterium]|nr:DUF3943 domain-containing protein [Bacteroidota bacterium]